MRDSDGLLTCLSDKPHGENVRDDVVHYFGCLRELDRQAFFESLEPKTKHNIGAEKRRIARMRTKFERNPRSPAGELLRKYKNTLGHWRRENSTAANTPASGSNRPGPIPLAVSRPQEVEALESNDDLFSAELETRAGMIFYHNSQPHNKAGYPDQFPDQKVSVNDLLFELDKSKNPLMEECPEGTIRYFRLPANNMSWVEEAIARYYNEDRPDLGGYSRPTKPHHRSKTQMLLRAKFWRGQQNGGADDAVHARHMRPFCDLISTDPVHTEKLPKNLVLFTPYLHWETDRRRAKSAEVIRQQEKKEKISSMAEVVDRKMTVDHTTTFMRETSDLGLEEVVSKVRTKNPLSSLHVVTHKTIQGGKLLGKLFLLAAALAEAIDYDADEKLIRDFLYKRPPLHPRRTLDQSYYWTLKDTQKRDRDQVVYRGTAPVAELMHHKCFKNYRENLEEGNYSQDKKDRKELVCRQCLEDVCKVPRVVMVDQLWMWILDENTIITSLPKRWGRNKPDPSGVYKSLRNRLKEARTGEVRSVYDLSLIILDQCSRVFFDRAKPTDRQPQVIDIFANAIGRVTYKQSIAFENFWEYTRIASKSYNSPERPFTRALKTTLLDIHTEAKLLREIKDILDELHIMIHIQVQQLNVTKTFVKNIKAILMPHLQMRRVPVGLNPSTPHFVGVENASSEERKKAEDVLWTMGLAEDLVQGMEDRIQELKTLRDAAEHTSVALKDLLALKQQQAGVVEAREAVEQAEETLKQGRAIMLFTVVTIIFLPLSFFTAIFGMNASELNANPDAPSLNDIFRFMLPISSVLIASSLLLAFSTFVRALLSFSIKIAWTYVVTRSGLYTLWQHGTSSSDVLADREANFVREMKAQAKLKGRLQEAKYKEEAERKRVEEIEGMNPTSVAGRVSIVSGNGDVEMGMRRSKDNRNRA